MTKHALNLSPISRFQGMLHPASKPSTVLQRTLACAVLAKSFAHLPHVRQRKHYQQIIDVLGQAQVAHVAMAELALDQPKQLFVRNEDASFECLQLLAKRIDRAAILHCFELTRHLRSFLIDFRMLLLYCVKLLHPLIARVGKDQFFFAVQLRMHLRDVLGVYCCGSHCVQLAGDGNHANVRLSSLSVIGCCSWSGASRGRARRCRAWTSWGLRSTWNPSRCRSLASFRVQ